MFNWYNFLNRSASKFRLCYNTTGKIYVENRQLFCGRNIKYDHQKSTIACTSVLTKIPRSYYSTKNNLRLNRDNVVSSAFEIPTLSEKLVHEFVWKNLERWPDKTATICSETGKSYTYSRLRTLSGKFASSLSKCRLSPESTIAVVLPNVPEYAIIVLGASEAGFRVTSSNPISTAKDISRQLQNSEASAVITTPEQYSVVKESISGNPNIKLPIIVIDDANNSLPSGSIRFSELISDSVEVLNESVIPDRNNEDTMFLPYSSGTTGMPKGVEMSHRNIVSNGEHILCPAIFPGYETTETHQDVVPLVLPIFHIFGLSIVLNHLSVGAKLVFLRQFGPEGILRCLKDFKSNILHAVPPLVLFLGSSDLVSRHHLVTLRTIIAGAAPIGAESFQRLLKKAQREIALAQGYGMTETSGAVSVSSNGLDNLNAAGYLIPNTKLRVVGVDESNLGKNMGVNETGEMYIKGPQVMKGYYKNPEATADTMDGEWLKTGDLGCFDETGHILIKDRLKELIKVKGFQVPPAELEELLRSNDRILDAAVIGEPHSRYGEVPKAFVVLRPGMKLDADAVKNFVAQNVPNYKQLGSVKFVNEIPKSAAGKILRRQLKDL